MKNGRPGAKYYLPDQINAHRAVYRSADPGKCPVRISRNNRRGCTRSLFEERANGRARPARNSESSAPGYIRRTVLENRVSIRRPQHDFSDPSAVDPLNRRAKKLETLRVQRFWKVAWFLQFSSLLEARRRKIRLISLISTCGKLNSATIHLVFIFFRARESLECPNFPDLSNPNL